MEFKWNTLKNERLKRARGISFEEILQAKPIGIKSHPSRELQEEMLFEWRNYVWVVPFVRAGDGIFLKTIYPSRKYTKKYRRGEL